MHIGLDMDGVLTEFVPTLIEQYNYLTNEHVKLDSIKSGKTSNYVNDPFLLKRLKDSTGFIRSLPPAPGAIDAVHKLVRDGHEITFVSNGTNCPSSGHEKRDWLFFYFSKLWKMAPLVLTHEKHKVRVDVLVDDDPKNLGNLHKDTKGLLWHQSYNAAVTGFDRVYSWDHLEEWIAING